MTTNRPRVRGWIFDWSFRGTGGVRIHFSEPLDSPGVVVGTKEPLVSLSDYEALQTELEKLRTCLAETAGVAVTMLYESHRQDTIKEFGVTELTMMVDCTKHLAGANVQVEKVYRKAWNIAQGCDGADWGGAQ